MTPAGAVWRAGAVWPPREVVDCVTRDLAGRASPIALVLGSGLGGMADALTDPWVREAAAIPGFPRSTVSGHRGRLLLGALGGRDVWVVQGRVHMYEGYTAEEVTRYVRLLHALGVRVLLLTNAAGSVDSAVGPGEILLAADAINLFFRPLAMPAVGCSGPVWRRREPLVDRELFALAQRVACERRIPIRTGILVGSLGPSYETAAEIQAWRALGGTVASMSTVPEAIVARELGMRCLLFSLVTNYGTGLSGQALRHEDVVRHAFQAGGRLAELLAAIVARLLTARDRPEA
jgi:inosine/guanosine/xanthosine phosphorylase family protein